MAITLNKTNVQRKKRLQLNSEINVTPFVDVMLVLLVIFMVTSPMLVTGIQVDLPKTQASSLPSLNEPIVVVVDKQGQVYLQDKKIKLDELGTKLSAILKEKKDTRIFVKGDKAIDYGKVMEVFGVIKDSGFTNLALVTHHTSHKDNK